MNGSKHRRGLPTMPTFGFGSSGERPRPLDIVAFIPAALRRGLGRFVPRGRPGKRGRRAGRSLDHAGMASVRQSGQVGGSSMCSTPGFSRIRRMTRAAMASAVKHIACGVARRAMERSCRSSGGSVRILHGFTLGVELGVLASPPPSRRTRRGLSASARSPSPLAAFNGLGERAQANSDVRGVGDVVDFEGRAGFARFLEHASGLFDGHRVESAAEGLQAYHVDAGVLLRRTSPRARSRFAGFQGYVPAY